MVSGLTGVGSQRVVEEATLAVEVEPGVGGDSEVVAGVDVCTLTLGSAGSLLSLSDCVHPQSSTAPAQNRLIDFTKAPPAPVLPACRQSR